MSDAARPARPAWARARRRPSRDGDTWQRGDAETETLTLAIDSALWSTATPCPGHPSHRVGLLRLQRSFVSTDCPPSPPRRGSDSAGLGGAPDPARPPGFKGRPVRGPLLQTQARAPWSITSCLHQPLFAVSDAGGRPVRSPHQRESPRPQRLGATHADRATASNTPTPRSQTTRGGGYGEIASFAT